MSTQIKETSDAFRFLTLCWESIPRKSWRNRNQAMHGALDIAISSGMNFSPEDMVATREAFNSGYWTSDGEGFYSLACKSGNIPAAIACEKWLGRPAVLWAEKVKTPSRLFVGERFTWEGHFVTVTSMASDKLVACTYKDQKESDQPEAGDVIWHGRQYRRIEAINTLEDGRIAMRLEGKVLSSSDYSHNSSTIARRFSITYEQLAAKRKEYDTRSKGYLKRIAEATTLDVVKEIYDAFAAEGRRAYRHFDIEAIQDAVKEANERIRETMTAVQRDEQRARENVAHDADLARWMAGEDVNTYFKVVRLRVKGDIVETSTRQSATVSGVRSALAFIKQHRRKGWHQNGTSFDLDQYPMHEINSRGVQVGCTFVEWAEVDRIAALL